ncbi:MAG: pyridoxal-phosphate dependent enzyme [Bacteroidetes bacterium]|nr:pyridoxal-phosphate dependent enzyme [Bacteroidota bacterium]
MNENITIQSIPSFKRDFIQVDILRLDELHPVVSGNKWFKLRFYIQQAEQQKAHTIASFGGPYSNHLVALAFAAKQNGFKSIGYVRSNANEAITPTLQEAIGYGMELFFLGRNDFSLLKNKLLQSQSNASNGVYYIDEGGYGRLGAQGAATILANEKTNAYSHIICAVGTGTMIAGLINASHAHQQIIGIPILKNENSIQEEIKALLLCEEKSFTILLGFHLGGYAKTNQTQFDFMNQLWKTDHIPTDIVYTSKLLMAVEQLIDQNYFEQNTKILVIHSGGLQGNRSLPLGTLVF